MGHLIARRAPSAYKKGVATRSITIVKLLTLAVLALPVTLMLAMHGRRDASVPPKGFFDTAPEAGIDFTMNFLPGEQGETFKANLYDHGSGLAAIDYDGDGLDDLFFLNQLGSNALFRNLGGWHFENATRDHSNLGLNDRVCVAAAFGDVDNDGDRDVYVTSTRGGNILFENRAGTYHDITEQAGVACVAHSQTAAFFDADNDGDLDLFVANTAKWTTDFFNERLAYYEGPNQWWQSLSSAATEANRLFRNDGDRKFTDVTQEAGVAGKGWGGDVAVFDFDEDGDLDLFVTNMFGLSQLYANDGQGRFTDVASSVLGRISYGAIGSKAFDYNGDGRLDLFITDMHSDMWTDYDEDWLVEPEKKYEYLNGRHAQFDSQRRQEEQKLALDYDAFIFGNTLLRNDGDGHFTEVSGPAGTETFWPWGVAVGDFDNNGYEDVYLPSGMGYPYFYWASCLLMNRGDGTFVNLAEQEGVEPPRDGKFLPEKIGNKRAPRSSRCAAVADFDGDGRLDVAVNNFNDRPFLYRNQFPQRNFAEFRLVGTKSNRDAIGAVMTLHCGDKTMVRQVQSSGGYLSQSSNALHFGLGDCHKIDRAEICWPSGARQVLESPLMNRLTEIREPD